MDVDEPVEHQQSSSSNLNHEGSTDKDPPIVNSGHSQEVGPDSEELNAQYQSLSRDSAYGTLSPESFIQELQPQPCHSEGEETEEEEIDREGQEEERVEAEIQVEEEKEEEKKR